jgi:hypothetical protein
MLEPKYIKLFIEPLNLNEVNYMVSGSVASIIYGEPRATMDIDVGIFINPGDYSKIPNMFPESDFYTPPLEVVKLESERDCRGHYNVIHHKTGYKADFYPSRNHPLLPWAFKNKVVQTIANIPVSIAPPEYVILWKLEFYRESKSSKHIRDIKGILRSCSLGIDFDLIKEYSFILSLQNEWEMITNAT